MARSLHGATASKLNRPRRHHSCPVKGAYKPSRNEAYMQIRKTTDNQRQPKINMLVYGHPGTGKTSFAAGADDVLIADVENGSLLLGLRGIQADVAHIETWDDLTEVYKLAKEGKYKTIVIDPIGELLDKLLDKLKRSGYGSNKGETLSIQGWGVAKTKFKDAIRKFRDLDVNLILVAHSSEKKAEEGVLVRPKLSASLDEDVCAMMDVVGYLKMTRKKDGDNEVTMYVQPTENYYAKDRSGVLPHPIEGPEFQTLLDTVLSSGDFQSKKKQDKHEAEFEASLEE